MDAHDQEMLRILKRLDKVETRMDRMQDWMNAKETQFALLAANLDNISTNIDKINNHIAKVVWLVVFGVLTAIGSFIMKGGLNAVT